MGPFYMKICSTLKLSNDLNLSSAILKKNKDHLEILDLKIQDVLLNLGETEHSDALTAKALYLAKIGEKVK